MNFADLENMVFAELKQRKDELLSLLGESKEITPVELAKRYLQRLMDAKQRDEKLSEQGKTITALEQNNQLLTEKCEQVSNAAKALESDRAVLVKHLEEVTASLTTEKERSERLKSAATIHAQAISTIAKTANDALAAQHVETASHG